MGGVLGRETEGWNMDWGIRVQDCQGCVGRVRYGNFGRRALGTWGVQLMIACLRRQMYKLFIIILFYT